ncbi:hypothetical protein ACLX1H_004629 [Fusarium chlamydosporum]
MSNSSQTSTDLLNPETEGTMFPQFVKMPYDVRASTWEQALSNQRLLRITLEKPESSSRNKNQRKKAKKTTRHGEVERESVSSMPYRVVLEERYAISKLFHVCAESRDAAKRFYRVKMGQQTQEGTFYFQPDLDNLQVGIAEHFSDFAFNLYQRDPLYVGLVNLTLPWQCNVHKLMEMNDGQRDILRGVLLRLENVSFSHMLEKPRTAPRPRRTLAWVHSLQVSGNTNGNVNTDTNNTEGPKPPNPRTGWEPDCTGPISTCIPSFEKLLVDPRPLGKDFIRPYFSFKNPIHIALSWFRLLQSLEAVYEHEVEYRVMLRYETTGRNTATREQAASWVRSQRKNFKARAVSEGLQHGEWAQPAMGSWLYPIKCVGSLVDDEGVLKTAKEILEGTE